MENSPKNSADSFLTPKKMKKSISLPSLQTMITKRARKSYINPYKSAGLRRIFQFKKPLVTENERKQSRILIPHDSLKSISPSYSDMTPKMINRDLTDEKIHRFPSISHYSKNIYPSLCSLSISEIMKKKREKSKGIFQKDAIMLKAPSFRDIEISPKKLLSVFERNSKKIISYTITEIKKPMESKTRVLFEKTLFQHFLFKNFSENYKDKLFDSMRSYEVAANAVLLKEESYAEMIYFLESGLIAAFKKEMLVRHLKAGSVIGEQQILSVSPLTCSYQALEKSIVWGVNSEVLAKIMLEMNEKKYQENREFLTPIHYFQNLDDQQIDEICYNMTSVRFGKGIVVIKEGESYVNFYIIKEGIALACQDNSFSHYLQKGEFFGQALTRKKGEPFTIFVDSEYLDCLCMNTETFKKILGGDYEKIVSFNLVETALMHSETFCKLTLQQVEQIIQAKELKFYPKNEKIPLEENLYVVIDGILSSKVKGRNLLCGELIGDESFISGKGLHDKIIALDECLLAVISREKIEKILGFDIKELLTKEVQKKDLLMDSPELKKPQIKVDFKKTMIIKILGEGLSGLVLLVEFEKKEYALKIISKGWVIENKLENYIRNEKLIQDKIDFPLITKIKTTSHDELSVYFFMEYIKGIDLFEILLQNQDLDELSTKFYTASLLLAVEYMHRKGILHRDLKPENVLIDEKGYIKLCDLGFGKLLLKKSQRSYTIVGTPHYMAPEMISGKGHSFPVDHYAIGVIAYMLYFGEFPFGEGLDDTFQIYNAIVNQKLKFPKTKPINDDLKFMLKKMLKKNPEARIGKNCESCRLQKWFENFSWDDLIEKKMEPPYIPEIQEQKMDNDIKNMSLYDLIQLNEIKLLTDMTNEMISSFQNWDDVF